MQKRRIFGAETAILRVFQTFLHTTITRNSYRRKEFRRFLDTFFKASIFPKNWAFSESFSMRLTHENLTNDSVYAIIIYENTTERVTAI